MDQRRGRSHIIYVARSTGSTAAAYTESQTIRLEATEPTFHLVRALRQRRRRWLGHILRMPDERLVRRTVLETAGNGPPYPPGSLLMDFEADLDEIKNMAEDRTVWNNIVNELRL